VTILHRLVNVEVLSLSINQISSLEPFAACHALRELYLRKNQIESVQEIEHLAALPELRVLWLSDNPCADAADYRRTAIRTLPGLEKLDNEEVTEEERAAAYCGSAGGSSSQWQQRWRHEGGSEERKAESSSRGRGITSSRQPIGVVNLVSPGEAQAAVHAQLPVTTAPPVAAPPVAAPPVAATSTSSDGAARHVDHSSSTAKGSSGSQAAAAAKQCSQNVLYAVMALLPELGLRELSLVLLETQRQLGEGSEDRGLE